MRVPGDGRADVSGRLDRAGVHGPGEAAGLRLTGDRRQKTEDRRNEQQKTGRLGRRVEAAMREE